MAIEPEALQETTNSIRVSFVDDATGDPVAMLMSNASDTYDALNRGRYTVSERLTQFVEAVDDSTVIVYVDAELTAGTDYVLTVAQVADENDDVLSEETSISFRAFGEVNARPVGDTPVKGRVDIANPQTPRDAEGVGSLGTFGITESGDLQNDTGRTNLRKRILRRLTVRPGGFFHLPDYGLGSESKTLITATEIRRLQVDVAGQIQSEPDVLAVRASVSEVANAPGVVRVKIRVRDSLGAFEVAGDLDLNGGDNA